MSIQTKVTFTFGNATFNLYQGSKLHDLCKELKEEFPELKMAHKRKLWWHWIAHVLIIIFTLGFNRRYISSFTTTGKNSVAWSDVQWKRLTTGSPEEHDRVWECLMHEWVHLRQFCDKGTFVMVITWAIPPILFCYGRAIVIEKPGYIVSLRCKFENSRWWAEHADYRKWWIGCFTGPSYGWMWLRKSQVTKWFDDELARLQKEADK
jgi:hypothetical protein